MDTAVSVVQLRSVEGEVASNLEKAANLVAEAADEGAGLVVLPEHFATGYSIPAMLAGAELPGGSVERRLVALAKEHDVVVIAAVAERTPRGVRTAALVVEPGAAVASRGKRRLWSAEKSRLARGDALAVAATRVGKVAPLVCYEVEFPEDARDAARLGAEILAVPAAFATPRLWDLATRSRAVENGIFVAAANLGPPFCGASRVVAPDGRVLASVDGFDGVAVARADDAAFAGWRKEHPYLADLDD